MHSAQMAKFKLQGSEQQIHWPTPRLVPRTIINQGKYAGRPALLRQILAMFAPGNMLLNSRLRVVKTLHNCISRLLIFCWLLAGTGLP
jgi:hypothetical protein